MAAKKRRTNLPKTKRRSGQTQTQSQGWTKSFSLIVGITVLVVAVIAGVVILGQDDKTAQPQLGEVSLDKSKGAEDAAVVVVEFGDFQ